MKTLFLNIIILLSLAGTFPVSAQYDSGTSTGYTCWQCPVCGYIVNMTAEEAASINSYTPCPVCYSAYAGDFIPLSCPKALDHSLPQADDDMVNSNDESTKKIVNGSTDTPSANLESSSDTPSRKGKILMVLSPEQYQEEELNVPRDFFHSKGYSVVLASKKVKTASGMNGESVQVDLDLKKVKLSDYIAVVFVGGEGIYSLKLNEDPDYIALAKSANSQKKLLGAICLAPWILADAGLLKGKRATASETDHIKAKGAIVSDEAVVKDGNIITANGPDASAKFAEAIISALQDSGGADGDRGIS
jgi:protease I